MLDSLILLSLRHRSLALMAPDASVFDIVWRMALCGAGFGMFQSPNNRAMMNAAPKSRSGGAGGMLATARLLGQTSGAAIVGMMFVHVPGQGAMVSLFIASGAAIVAAFVSLARLYEGPAIQAMRASNPEADPGMHADVLKQQTQQPPKEP